MVSCPHLHSWHSEWHAASELLQLCRRSVPSGTNGCCCCSLAHICASPIWKCLACASDPCIPSSENVAIEVYSRPQYYDVEEFYAPSKRGQGRAEQGRAGQGRAGQGRAGQGRAGQGRAGPREGLWGTADVQGAGAAGRVRGPSGSGRHAAGRGRRGEGPAGRPCFRALLLVRRGARRQDPLLRRWASPWPILKLWNLASKVPVGGAIAASFPFFRRSFASRCTQDYCM